MFVDLPLEQLRGYTSPVEAPHDLEPFWRGTLDAARERARPPLLTPVDLGLVLVDVLDVTFTGFDGQPVKAWLRLPRGVPGPLPCVVQYVGYTGGRGRAADVPVWPLAGYAHLHVDNRGQPRADTPDPGADGAPQEPGFVTRGIGSPATWYYRRLVTDAYRALETARALPQVDPGRVVLSGVSQGGGLALAAAGLAGLTGVDVAGVAADVPFLCDWRHASEITDSSPYRELADFVRDRPEQAEQAYATLAYADGVVLAARAQAPALFSVGLMDAVCPPSTVFAAFNAYGAADKEIAVYPYGGHDAADTVHRDRVLAFVRRVAPPSPTRRAEDRPSSTG